VPSLSRYHNLMHYRILYRLAAAGPGWPGLTIPGQDFRY
jgi:hypothetical protein